MERAWTPRRQGDLGELSAMEWLAKAGASVFVPLLHSPDYDLVADFGDGPLRVQVKTSTCWVRNRWVVALCTRGGNQSWNRVVKRIDASRCDKLFVHVGDGRRWFIPISALDGGSGMVLGGPKFAAYEVESSDPLPSRSEPVATARIEAPSLD
jgi:hypothetical protein